MDIAIPVRCPKCGWEGIYKPRGDHMPEMPHKKCARCGNYIYVESNRLPTEIGESDATDIPGEVTELRDPGSGASSSSGHRRAERFGPSEEEEEPEEPRYESITMEMVEDLLLRWANGDGTVNRHLVRYCIDFLKGFKDEISREAEEELDLEGFLQVGEITESRRKVRPPAESEV